MISLSENLNLFLNRFLDLHQFCLDNFYCRININSFFLSSIKPCSNSIRLFFTFKNLFFCIFSNYILPKIFISLVYVFYLYMLKRVNRVISSDFNWFISHITHVISNIYNSYYWHNSYLKFCLLYIKMLKKYHQKQKERLEKEAFKDIKIFLKKKKK